MSSLSAGCRAARRDGDDDPDVPHVCRATRARDLELTSIGPSSYTMRQSAAAARVRSLVKSDSSAESHPTTRATARTRSPPAASPSVTAPLATNAPVAVNVPVTSTVSAAVICTRGESTGHWRSGATRTLENKNSTGQCSWPHDTTGACRIKKTNASPHSACFAYRSIDGHGVSCGVAQRHSVICNERSAGGQRPRHAYAVRRGHLKARHSDEE